MEEVNTARPKIVAADKALTELHTEPQCTRLVESIVTKYLALTSAELEEWQVRAAASLARYAQLTVQPRCSVSWIEALHAHGFHHVCTICCQIHGIRVLI